MHFELDRDDDKWGEPALSEMVEKSVDILKRSEDGYFLYVEGMYFTLFQSTYLVICTNKITYGTGT